VASGSTATLTLQARDGAGNNLTAGGATVVFSTSGPGTSTGTIGATSDHGDGTYTATFTGVLAGNAKTISATIGGNRGASTLPTITVTSGPVSTAQSTVSTSVGTVVSGATATFTVRAKDAAGNNITTGGLTIVFNLTGGTSTGTLGAVTDQGDGSYTAIFTG